MTDTNAGWESLGRSCYGVDAAGDRLIAVRGTRRGRDIDFCRIDLTSPSAAGEAASGRALMVACLNERESLARWVEAPFSSREKARRVFSSLLDIQLPFPLEECAHAFLETKAADKRGTRALAVVARFEDLRRRLAELQARGIDPVMFDQEGLALWTQSLSEIPAEKGAAGGDAAPVRVVVYLGEDRITAAIGRGLDFASAHSVDPGRPEDLDRVLKSEFPSAPPSLCWCFAGPGAEERRRVESLAARLQAGWPGAVRIHHEPAAFLARALAARALLPGPYRCNLRAGPRELIHPEMTRRAERRSLTSVALLLAAGVALCGVNIAWRVAVERKGAALQTAVAGLAREVSGMQTVPRGAEVLMAGRALDNEAARLAPFIRAFQPSAVQLLTSLAVTAKQERLNFDNVTLSGHAISVEGTAPDSPSVQRLSKRLAAAGYRNTVEPRGALNDGRIRFVLSSGEKR